MPYSKWYSTCWLGSDYPLWGSPSGCSYTPHNVRQVSKSYLKSDITVPLGLQCLFHLFNELSGVTIPEFLSCTCVKPSLIKERFLSFTHVLT